MAIIPYIIFKFRTKKHNNEIEEIKNNITLIYNKANKKIVGGKWVYIFLSAILFFIQGILYTFSFKIFLSFWILNILLNCLFSFFILKVNLYKHHYISMTIIIILGIALDLTTTNIREINIVILIVRFIREIFSSLQDVINKYAMEKKFCSVYELTFYTGLINSILFTIFGLINYYALKLKEIDDFDSYFKSFDAKELLVSIGYIIIQLGLYICILITSKNYTPCHIFIIISSAQLLYYLIAFWDFTNLTIAIIIFLLLIIFMGLVFNEIIELNFWGLSINTRKNIGERAEEDDLLIIDKKVSLDENYEVELNIQKDNNSETNE